MSSMGVWIFSGIAQYLLSMRHTSLPMGHYLHRQLGYLKGIPICEAVTKDFTYFQPFWHCKRDLWIRIAFNCFSVSWAVICIHVSSYSEFQYNNWKNKAGIFEYLTVSLGGSCPGCFCPRTELPMNHIVITLEARHHYPRGISSYP